MAGKSATIAVKILGDSKGAQRAVEDTSSKMDKFKSGMKKAAMVAGGVLAAEGALAKGLVDHARAARDTNGKIENMTDRLGIYGDEHDQVADRIINNAEKMSANTGIDDKAIKSAQTMLLGFDDLADSAGEAGGMFDRVTQAAVDMDGQGMKPADKAAKDLARSLDEPETGLKRLERSGISFTDQQKEQIKAMAEAGDKAGAQAEIMEAVESKVKGAGEANADAADKAAAKWSMAQDELGEKLLPVYDKLMDALTKVTEFATEHSDAVIAVGAAIAGLATAVLVAQGAIMAYSAVTKTVQAVTKAWTAVQWLLNAAMSANPIMLVVIAVAALVAGIIYAWNNVDGFKEAVVAAWEWIKETTETVFTAVTDFIGDAIDKIGTFFTETLPEAVQTVLDWLGENWPLVVSIITGPVGALVTYIITHWQQIKDKTVEIFNALLDWIKDVWNTIKTWLTDKVTGIATAVVNGFQSLVDGAGQKIDALLSWVRDIPNRIMTALAGIGTLLSDSGRQLIQGFIDGITGMLSSVTNAVSNIVSSARDFFPFSPAKRGPFSGSGYTDESGRALAGDFAQSIRERESDVRRAAGRLMTAAHITPQAAAAATTAPAQRSRQGRDEGGSEVINITVNGALDPQAVARQIRRLLLDHNKKTGRTRMGARA